MGDRLALTEFWEKQSHMPTVQTMMLNKFAENVDEQDKNDILASLPNLDGMRIVELGAGIGRFTPILAEKAKHVIAADIVESFIDVNRNDNGHMGNISFQTGEASAMKIDDQSINFLFTNWLLMYLTDAEVIHLLQNGLAWLSAGGYLHIRESCSEPSKRNAVAVTPNGVCQTAESNPTHYRHICQYLNLLNAITMQDEENNNLYYKFRILWSKSVDTYIEAYGNWRQVQILVKKVVVPTDDIMITSSNNLGSPDVSRLLKTFKNDTLTEQNKFDSVRKVERQYFPEQSSLASKFLFQAMVDLNCQEKLMMVISLDDRLSISPFEASAIFDSHVNCIETCPLSFNNDLAEAVDQQNKRVRLQFLNQLDSPDGEEWNILKQKKFDVIIGCRMVNSVKNFAKFITHAKNCLAFEGKFLFLEESDNENSLRQVLQNSDCQNAKLKDITVEFLAAAKKRSKIFSENLPILSTFYESIVENNKQWFIVEIHF